MKTPGKPTLGKIRSGFLPLTMGNAAATRAHPQKHSPLPGGSPNKTPMAYGRENKPASVSKRSKRMY